MEGEIQGFEHSPGFSWGGGGIEAFIFGGIHGTLGGGIVGTLGGTVAWLARLVVALLAHLVAGLSPVSVLVFGFR